MDRPIGMFDSGFGGLTVARAVIDLLTTLLSWQERDAAAAAAALADAAVANAFGGQAPSQQQQQLGVSFAPSAPQYQQQQHKIM